jgi:hypothetical protein
VSPQPLALVGSLVGHESRMLKLHVSSVVSKMVGEYGEKKLHLGCGAAEMSCSVVVIVLV